MVNYSSPALDATFGALSDPTRRAILVRLALGEAMVTELAQPFEMSLPAISKHLRVLESAGLLQREIDGRVHRCRLAAKPMKDAVAWIEKYRAFWETQFDALEKISAGNFQQGEQAMATPKQTPEFTLQIRRTFAAPREKVFAVWTRREQLEQWMCKDVAGHAVIHHEQDIRTGGRYLMEVRDPAKGETYWAQGIYREVKRPERIIFTWSWTKDTPDGAQLHSDSPETQVTVEFFVRGNSTEVILTHSAFATAKDRDEHDQGWNGCLDVLANVLQATSTPS